MSRATTPPGVRDLHDAARREPAAQEAVREPPTGGGSAYYQDAVRLPGFGFAPERCRALQPVGFCQGHGHVQLGRSSCGTRRCPDHWRDWLTRAVENIVARLAAYRYVQEGAGKRLLHAVVSPDQERRWTDEAFWDARSGSYEAAEAAGARGGVTVPHPYRSSEEGERLWEMATEHGDVDDDLGKWSLFRDASDGWGEMQEYVEAAPHYHMLAPSEDFQGGEAPAGWVAKNIRSLPRFHVDDVEAYRPMAKVAYYLLTHSGMQEGRQTVTYWGEVHPAAFNPEEELTKARWDRIQEYAHRAVHERPGEGAAGTGEEEETCGREECDSVVVPIEELHDYMNDEAWVRSLGRHERLELRGVQAWARFGDRPPPDTEEKKVRRWLRRRGRLHSGLGNPQTGLGAFQ